MKVKIDNNLIKITLDCNGKEFYFTSSNRAGKFIFKQTYNIERALITTHRIEFTELGPVTVELVDGSEIPYKLINPVYAMPED